MEMEHRLLSPHSVPGALSAWTTSRRLRPMVGFGDATTTCTSPSSGEGRQMDIFRTHSLSPSASVSCSQFGHVTMSDSDWRRREMTLLQQESEMLGRRQVALQDQIRRAEANHASCCSSTTAPMPSDIAGTSSIRRSYSLLATPSQHIEQREDHRENTILRACSREVERNQTQPPDIVNHTSATCSSRNQPTRNTARDLYESSKALSDQSWVYDERLRAESAVCAAAERKALAAERQLEQARQELQYLDEPGGVGVRSPAEELRAARAELAACREARAEREQSSENVEVSLARSVHLLQELDKERGRLRDVQKELTLELARLQQQLFSQLADVSAGSSKASPARHEQVQERSAVPSANIADVAAITSREEFLLQCLQEERARGACMRRELAAVLKASAETGPSLPQHFPRRTRRPKSRQRRAAGSVSPPRARSAAPAVATQRRKSGKAVGPTRSRHGRSFVSHAHTASTSHVS